jgi:hypothetical protein
MELSGPGVQYMTDDQLYLRKKSNNIFNLEKNSAGLSFY